MTALSRRPAGTPAGGQFSGRSGGAPDVELSDTATAGAWRQPARTPKPGTYLSQKASLVGPTWEPMNSARAEQLGMACDGFSVVETSSGKARAYIRDSHRTLPANRTRPAVAVFEIFEVETYADTVDGRPTVLGRPAAAPSGELFARIDCCA